MGFLGKIKRPILKLLAQAFSDPELAVTITYRVFAGRDEFNEKQYTDVSLKAIPTEHVSERSPLHEAMQQAGTRHYMIRERDLPGALTHKDLSGNDLAVVGGEECRIIELAKAPGFVISFVAKGNS